MSEGYADAMRLWFEQWRNPTLSYTAAQLDELYVTGAGNTSRNSVNPSRGFSRPQVTQDSGSASPLSVDLACETQDSNGDNADDLYYKGMVLSQVLWPFLTNRVCFGLTTTCDYWQGSPPANPVQQFLTNVTVAQSADVIRQDFQHALIIAGDNDNFRHPRYFLEVVLSQMNTYHKAFLTTQHGTNWSRVLDVFQRHGVTP